MSKVVIFGAVEIAEIAHFYFKHDSEHDVVAFTVDKEFLQEEEFCGLPVVPFEEIEERFPPSSYRMFIALSYSNLNKTRETKFQEAKSRGVSANQLCEFQGHRMAGDCKWERIVLSWKIIPFSRLRKLAITSPYGAATILVIIPKLEIMFLFLPMSSFLAEWRLSRTAF